MERRRGRNADVESSCRRRCPHEEFQPGPGRDRAGGCPADAGRRVGSRGSTTTWPRTRPSVDADVAVGWWCGNGHGRASVTVTTAAGRSRCGRRGWTTAGRRDHGRAGRFRAGDPAAVVPQEPQGDRGAAAAVPQGCPPATSCPRWRRSSARQRGCRRRCGPAAGQLAGRRPGVCHRDLADRDYVYAGPTACTSGCGWSRPGCAVW